jgi:hypothetical protein
MKLKGIVLGISCAVGLMVVGFAKPASATAGSLTCDGGMIYVDFQQMSPTNTRLQFGCWSGGVEKDFYSYTGSASCTGDNVTLDTLKGFKASAESALLSGKQIIVYYDLCGSSMYTSTFSLRR